ncbi:VOC family protein [Kitasatospora purpeofusca]|uniref:ArsI/CadI family heavy metal resistance metalloenzyme n=1 Tax=Kitasatospora purpeofusca TaxID=67352 RepID=UPI002E10ECE7|nr:VOC family protein [Kitasatospora purpeofusca]
MPRIQLALRVADLEGSIAFYSRLFDTEPAKRRPGYANFAITTPPLKLVLIEGPGGEDTRLDHLGIEVGSTEEVSATATRLKDAGLATFEENDTSCCYALQDKVWVHGPGSEPWEVHVVKGDADALGKAITGAPATCCTSDRQTAGTSPDRAGAEATADAACACGG